MGKVGNKRGHAIRMALAGVAALGALGLAACQSGSAPGPMPAATTVLDDQLVGRIKQGETKMDQVRALIDAKPIVNYQAGREIWIYQGVPMAASTQARTLTVQYDERGVVRNVGVTDLK
jgi:outer membrane protein assembly factor BamE (lipoprotein component of BamABCDE complex)